MNSYLLLVDDPSIYPSVNGVDISSIYYPVNKFLRAVRFFHNKCGVLGRFKCIWLSRWKYRVNSYSDIVIMDSIFDYTPLEYIKAYNYSAKLIFCFRNRVNERIAHSVVDRNPIELRTHFSCELWSYSADDCRLYKMKYYNQFFLISESIRRLSYPIRFDAFFIGSDKQRMSQIMKLKQIMDDLKLVSRFEVIADPHRNYKEEESKLLAPMRSYREVLDLILSSRSVIDIVSDVNYGMTYRSLEACFLKKKLITNYSEIVKADFYNKNNVFILGKDDISRLRDFVESPFDESGWNVIYNYSFKHFCERVFDLGVVTLVSR